MNPCEDLFRLMCDIHRVKNRITKLNRKHKLKDLYPNTYDHLHCSLNEACSDLADYYVAHAELIFED